MNPSPLCELTVIFPFLEKLEPDLSLIEQVYKELNELHIRFEILIVSRSNEGFSKYTERDDMRVLLSSERYGTALLKGFENSHGDFILVMDTDQQYQGGYIQAVWGAREDADVIIASRYIKGAYAYMSPLRLFFSRILNLIFSRGLDLKIADMSSGIRFYRSHLVKKLSLTCTDYDILQEILVMAFMEGYQVREIPFEYHAMKTDEVFTRITRFGVAYLKTFSRLWRLRNSIASSDYDARAYDALMPPQRYWQRQRYKHITGMLDGQGKCLDVGCGSSRIIGELPEGSVAVDILLRKLRYAKRYGQMRTQASLFNLPVENESFPCVLCSQVIEHIPRDGALEELDRVLQCGGILILGTPDYAKWQWLVIEWLYKIILPQAYADEHITHYTYEELIGEFVVKRGYQLIETHYILQGELILGLKKPSR